MMGLRGDCRHALRLYTHAPAASTLAIIVLAVGMAFVSAFLSLYVDLILRPHPGFGESHRIATVGQNDGRYLSGIPFEVAERIADDLTSVEAAGMSHPTTALVGQEHEVTPVEVVSEGLFSTLRPRLAVGRGFRPEDHAPGAEPVAVVSYSYWQQRFGGNPGVLGTTVEITRDPRYGYHESAGRWFATPPPDEEPVLTRIIGVLPDTVASLAPFESGRETGITAFWIPLESAISLLPSDRENVADLPGTVFVRLHPGIGADAVVSELGTRYAGEGTPLVLRPGARLDAIEGIVRNFGVQREAKRQLEMFLAGSVLLALVAAANISLFLLARSPGRRRELGIRLAVGAPVGRIARQLATEAGMLVIVSAALGLLLSVWLSTNLRNLAFIREAEWRDVTLLDWRVLSLTAAFLLVLTLLVSLAPILGVKRMGIGASSRHVMARASLAQRLAGNAQIAVAGALGGPAIAFAWYVGSLVFGDPGYETTNRYLVDGLTDGLNHGPLAFVEIAGQRETIEAIPGVTAVGYGFPVPGERLGGAWRMDDPRDASREIEMYRGVLDRAYIDVLELELVHGRAPEDGEGGIGLVNQALARLIWGRDDVVGERLPVASRTGEESMEVIGVLRDMSFEHPSAAVKPHLFLSLGNPPVPSAIVAAQLTAAELWQALEQIAATGRLEAQVRNVRSLDGMYRDLTVADRARGSLTISSAVLVVLLTAFGFYGTQRYLVAAGRREIAIRASLGAGPRALGRLVLSRGLFLGLPGLVASGLLAFIAAAWLRDDYLGGEISPVIVAMAVVAGLTLVLIGASAGPAREARRTPPAPLLREN